MCSDLELPIRLPTFSPRPNDEALHYDIIAFVACGVAQIVVGSRTEKDPCFLARTRTRRLKYEALLDDMIAIVAWPVSQIVVGFRTEKCPCVGAS